MQSALIFVVLFAQFVRPTMPHGREWADCKKTASGISCKWQRLEYGGEFTVPKSGTYSLNYQSLYPAKYDGKTVKAVAQFCDNKGCTRANKAIITVADESYTHITIKAKPGSHWWYVCVIAVSNLPPSQIQ